jgi:hypothetical protein
MQNQVDPQAHAPVAAADKVPAMPTAPAHDAATERKPFVEPRLSAPTDVLEATKFFAEPVSSGFV